MTIDELKALAETVLVAEIETLKRTGSINAKFILSKRDGAGEICVVPGGEINSREFKTALAKHVRARIATGEITSLIFISDAFFADNLTPEGEKIRRAFGLDIEQSAKAGLCELRECLTMQVESPILRMHIAQEYKRDGETISLVGDRIVMTEGENGRVLPSKLGAWFPEVPVNRV
jgi:hypothetical protein